MRLPKTLNIQIGKKLRDQLKEDIMKEVFKVFNLLGVVAVQLAYDVIRVTFSTDEGFRQAKELTGVRLFGLWCPILSGGPPVMIVYVFDYPYKENNTHVSSVFDDFGEVKKVKNQTYLSNANVYTGTRLVFMVLNSTLPRGLTINGYLCRVWYKGQPLVCNLCNVQGHKAAVCPNKDKCCQCGEQGHFAHNCTKNFEPPSAPSDDASAGPPPPLGGGASSDSSAEPLIESNAMTAGSVQNDSLLNGLSAGSSKEPNAMATDNVQNEPLEQIILDDQNAFPFGSDDNESVLNDDVDSDDNFVEVIEKVANFGNDECSSEDVVTIVIPTSSDGCPMENSDSAKSNTQEAEINGAKEIETNTPCSMDTDITSADGLECATAPIRNDPPAPSGAIGTETSSEGSIVDSSEGSQSQSILNPERAPPVRYGSRSHLGKATSSVKTKLLPRKQPVVRSVPTGSKTKKL